MFKVGDKVTITGEHKYTGICGIVSGIIEEPYAPFSTIEITTHGGQSFIVLPFDIILDKD